jgi:hypothetical protein
MYKPVGPPERSREFAMCEVMRKKRQPFSDKTNSLKLASNTKKYGRTRVRNMFHEIIQP